MRFLLILWLAVASFVAHSATMVYQHNLDNGTGLTVNALDGPYATTTTSTSIKANGTGSQKMSLNRSDLTKNAYRSEYTLGTSGDLDFNKEYWLNINFYFDPVDWATDTSRDFFPFQIHRRPGVDPATGEVDWNCDKTSAYATEPFFATTVNNTFELRGWPNGTLFWSSPLGSGGLTKGVWHNLVMRFDIGSDNNGYFEAWVDNVKRVTKLNYTLFTSGTDQCGRQFGKNFWKMGTYKWDWKPGRPATQTSKRIGYIDDFKLATGANGYALVYTPPSGTSPGDTTPPVISNVASSSITSSSATITWTTDEAATTVVDYGTTTSYGTTVTGTPSVTSHSITLSGLALNTTYNFRVKSADSSSNLATSGNFTFTTLNTDTVSPVISNVVVTPGATTATFTWNTNEPATSRVKLETPVAQSIFLNPLVTSHSIQFTGLSPSTAYTYKITSVDAAGNPQNHPSTGTLGFSTTSASSPPVVTGVSATSTKNSMTLTWTTDVASDSAVAYGLSPSKSSQASNASMVTSHSLTVNGLTPNRRYYFLVRSTSAGGTGYPAAGTSTVRTKTNSGLVNDGFN